MSIHSITGTKCQFRIESGPSKTMDGYRFEKSSFQDFSNYVKTKFSGRF